MVLVIVGFSGSGKTTIAENLLKNKKFDKIINVGDIAKKLAVNPLDLIDDDKLLNALLNDLTDNSIVTGIRELYIYEYLQERFDVNGIRCICPKEVRRDRLLKRGLTLKQAKEKERIDLELGLDELYHTGLFGLSVYTDTNIEEMMLPIIKRLNQNL